jgi:RNA-binding protein YhbY
MTLVVSNDKNIYKHLNDLFIKINTNIWIGKVTNRELERLNNIINEHKLSKTHIFKTSKEDFEKYLKNTIDFLLE